MDQFLNNGIWEKIAANFIITRRPSPDRTVQFNVVFLRIIEDGLILPNRGGGCAMWPLEKPAAAAAHRPARLVLLLSLLL